MRNNEPVFFSIWGFKYTPLVDFRDEEIKQDSTSSIPYNFVVEHINDEYRVTDSRVPRDGSYYVEDMKKSLKEIENV